jgi:hypothetical protein
MKRFALTCLAALATIGVARADNFVTPAEERFWPYSAQLPACDDAAVLSRITERFAQKETEFWNSQAQINGYDRIRQIGFRANGLGYIPRRYCVARAELSDMRKHEVIYAIGENLGIIGWGFGVEWCVIGFDRNLAFAPDCTVLRPFLDRNLGEKALRARY